MRVVGIMVVCAVFAAQAATGTSLDIYFIDVEGGQATLIVTPAKETLLIDSGWPGKGEIQSKASRASEARDAQRIAEAARDAGVTKIDFLVITHFHRDHVGGASELAQLLPIRTFVDYGSPVPIAELGESAAVDGLDAHAFDTYKAVRELGRHVVPKVGDPIPLKGVQAIVVSTDRSTLAEPLAGGGARNVVCRESAIEAADAFENPRSIGVLIQYGTFRFLGLGDLSGQPLFDLTCPIDRIGPVDVYLLPHHGHVDTADPAILAAFKPRVAVINNGAWKGNSPETNRGIREAQGVEDVWQLHRSEKPGAENVAQENIANLGEQTAHWIKVRAKEDGSFGVSNGRTGVWKEYGIR